MRIIRKWEDDLLMAELAECREVMTEYRERGDAPSTGLAMYEMGLRTAAIMLGTEPSHWQRKPWLAKVWRRWVQGRA